MSKEKDTIKMYFGSAFYEAWFSENVTVEGIGTMILALRTAGGVICGATFLCDQYCLGVKDCFAFLEPEGYYRSLLERIRENEELRPVDGGTLRQYIAGLVRWAREVGFEPHHDFRFCSQILLNFPANTAVEFTYGKDGVPFYINGPYDTPARIEEIAQKLQAYRERTGMQADYLLIGEAPPLTQLEIVEPEAPIHGIRKALDLLKKH